MYKEMFLFPVTRKGRRTLNIEYIVAFAKASIFRPIIPYVGEAVAAAEKKILIANGCVVILERV